MRTTEQAKNCSNAKGGGMSVLYYEHLSLGARFKDGLVAGYACDEETQQADVLLADMSHVCLTLLSGKSAQDFAEATFAGKKLLVGECSFEAVLTGDGNVSSIPMLARTGNSEYLCADASPRAEILNAWLSFIKSASRDGFCPYAGLNLEDVTGSHVVLGLSGRRARDVLLDYTSKESLPMPGQVNSCMLDRIPCVVVCIPTNECCSYMLFVPPQFAVVLWRSLLSFTFVSPACSEDFVLRVSNEIDSLDALNSTDTISISKRDLARNGLVRPENDYIGSHGLAQRGEASKA